LASFNPYELNNIILEATSQVERIITPSLVIGTYGKEIFTATFFIIGLLIIALVIVLNSHKKLNFQRKKYMAISEVSNEYLFEYSSLHKTLHLSNKFKTLFSTQTTLKAAQNTLISTLASLPIEESEVIELNLPSGKMHTFLLSAIKVSKQRSGTKTWIGKLLDISEEKAKQKHLENLAQKDGLTDLLNASTTRHQIEKRLTQKLPEERDFCILFDLDDFKAVNDSGGHLVGDRVLQTIGEIMLQTQSSTLDILGRVGGDEFCIYLIDVPSYETVISYCTSLLEIVRSRLQEEGVTISLGVVEVQKGETYEELYTRVDNALYTSKANGKNRMEIM
ncbi:MAG: GGDEF domain-containing protein, partial [Sphaerochaetaceae bacterium]|nr:GGDEF domain-containing protein [Sphaerochaetaceae bacterium]